MLSLPHWSLLPFKFSIMFDLECLDCSSVLVGVCCVWHLFEHEKSIGIFCEICTLESIGFVNFSWYCVFAAPSSKNNGFIYAKIFGGFDKIRSSVCISWLDNLRFLFIFSVLHFLNGFANFLDMWSCHHIQASKCYSYHSRVSRKSSLKRH